MKMYLCAVNNIVAYDGNRLTGVTEAAPDYDATGTFEYKGANGSEYLYDSNGSLIADRSRRIGHVIYDANGNPLRIQFTNGSVTKYVYSATGEKLRAIHQTAIPNISVPVGRTRELAFYEIQYADSTDYLLGGSLTLKNGRIDKCLFDGGYARAIQTSATTDRFVFYYYNKDHLGNNRELETSTGTIYQVTDYYPFGAPYADPDAVLSADRQPYKYNGKELDRMHGLDTYDYGARQYYSILGRWDRMDPLAEKYYNLSPYNYCGNNPVNAIDVEGKKTIFVNGKIGGGSPEAGAPYWGQYGTQPCPFINGALKFFNDTNYKILVADYNIFSSAEDRFSIGYEYAKNNLDVLTLDLKDGETFNFVSHSMGAALSEGIAKYLEEHGYKVSNIVHINPFQAADITTLGSSFTVDFQYVNDPVIHLPLTQSGRIKNADFTIRALSSERIDRIHASPIWEGDMFWKALDYEISKGERSIYDLVKELFQ